VLVHGVNDCFAINGIVIGGEIGASATLCPPKSEFFLAKFHIDFDRFRAKNPRVKNIVEW
jgi:hypothetical protein